MYKRQVQSSEQEDERDHDLALSAHLKLPDLRLGHRYDDDVEAEVHYAGGDVEGISVDMCDWKADAPLTGVWIRDAEDAYLYDDCRGDAQGSDNPRPGLEGLDGEDALVETQDGDLGHCDSPLGDRDSCEDVLLQM